MPHRRTDVIATVWCRVSWLRWGQRILYHRYLVCWVRCFTTGHVGALVEGKKSLVWAFSAWAGTALGAVWGGGGACPEALSGGLGVGSGGWGRGACPLLFLQGGVLTVSAPVA